MTKTTILIALCGLALVAGFGMGVDSCEPEPTSPVCDQAEADACTSHGVWNPETCTCCAASAHQQQECEQGQGGRFDWQRCACVLPCTFGSDCSFGDECEAGWCAPSECHEGNPFDPSVPSRPCPSGETCHFADGVDLNHGNGWCE